MKFDCWETEEEKRARLESWHTWFAWRPVRIGPHDCRWLERLRRRGVYKSYRTGYGWVWEYQEYEAD